MPKRKKQSRLTRAARGQDCALCLVPHCVNDPETVVLAHMPHIDNGMGTKGPDYWSAFACHVCHDIVDGRVDVGLPAFDVLQAVYKGVQRTQKIFKEMELIEVRL